MNNKLIMAFITSCLLSNSAFAFTFSDDDCTDPVEQWQPREQLRQMLHSHGWQVNRIKVDDGCYEVKGLDRQGHRVKASFSPASLRIIELEVKFDETGDVSNYLDGWPAAQQPNNENRSGADKPIKRPKVTIE